MISGNSCSEKTTHTSICVNKSINFQTASFGAQISAFHELTSFKDLEVPRSCITSKLFTWAKYLLIHVNNSDAIQELMLRLHNLKHRMCSAQCMNLKMSTPGTSVMPSLFNSKNNTKSKLPLSSGMNQPNWETLSLDHHAHVSAKISESTSDALSRTG